MRKKYQREVRKSNDKFEHRPNPSAGCVRWGKQPGYVAFRGQKIPLERPRVRTREGQEVELSG